MSFSNEWTEWHLTPRGWESGSERVDGQGLSAKDPPPDRVLTYRWSEVQTSGFGKMHRTLDKKWESEDADAIKALLGKFGQPPNSL
jgi:hypothetical protein